MAELGIAEPLRDHRRTSRRQTPILGTRRQMCAGKVVVLMTRGALFRGHSMTVGAAPHIHYVRMPIIALTRKVAARMAVHTSWMPQHRDKGKEKTAVSLCPIGSRALFVVRLLRSRCGW